MLKKINVKAYKEYTFSIKMIKDFLTITGTMNLHQLKKNKLNVIKTLSVLPTIYL